MEWRSVGGEKIDRKGEEKIRRRICDLNGWERTGEERTSRRWTEGVEEAREDIGKKEEEEKIRGRFK